MERLRNCGGSLTIPCQGSLIVPSGNIDTLPLVNEFTLDPRRLTTAQSPLGGVNGLISYSPGSVHVTEGDGIYLTDVAGNNTSKDLPAGLLSRLGYLTVDTVAHTITEEFIVANTNTSNNPSQFESWATTNGWYMASGSGTLSIENGKLKCVGTATSSGMFIAKKNNYSPINASDKHFLNVTIRSDSAGTISVGVLTDVNNYRFFEGNRFPISANADKTYVIPIKAPVGTTGQNPTTVLGTMNFSSLTQFLIGVRGLTDGQSVTMYISPLSLDTSRSAYIETAVPDNIASVVYQKWTGATYETNCIANMDSVYSTTFSDSAKMVLNDQTKFDDVYGSGNGRSRFVKGVSGQTVNGSLAGTTMTYSAVKGTKNRIGIRVDLPPSDGGRTAFNQCLIKKIIYYDDLTKTSLIDSTGVNNGALSGQYTKAIDGMSFLQGFGYCTISKTALSQNSITLKTTVTSTGSSGVADAVFRWGNLSDSNNIYIDVLVGKYRVIQYNSSGTYKIFTNGTYTPASNDVFSISFNASNLIVYLNGTKIIDSTCVTNFDISKLTTVVVASESLTSCLRGAAMKLFSLTVNDSTYSPTMLHMGQSTQEFSNDNNASTGLLNISKPWLAIIDPTTKNIYYYLFTERPTSLSYKRDESGNVYEVVVNPGNGLVYKGSTIWANYTLDSNSDSKPDMLDATIQNSIAQMLSVYGFNR